MHKGSLFNFALLFCVYTLARDELGGFFFVCYSWCFWLQSLYTSNICICWAPIICQAPCKSLERQPWAKSHDPWPTNQQNYQHERHRRIVEEAPLVGLTLCPPDPHSMFSISQASQLPALSKLTNQQGKCVLCSLSPKCLPFPYFLWLTVIHPSSHSSIFIFQRGLFRPPPQSK